ncbi:MAG: xanthine dehydrogenase family protein molybdopterin-binding subunit [Thermosphaera sp.]
MVGNPNVNRVDTLDKISGKAIYSYDVNPAHIGEQRFVYLGFWRSSYPHARIRSIDVSRAEARGYVTLTGRDLPRYALVGARPHTPLPIDRVMYVGEAVVAVAAPSPSEVEDALDLIEVDLEPLPYVLDEEEAIRPDAPKLWPDGNIAGGGFTPEEGPIPAGIRVSWGDVEAGFASADEIVEAKFKTPIEQHYEMEPRAIIATWRDNKLYIYYSGQYAHSARNQIASYFRMPVNDVIVRTSLGGESGHVLGMALGNKSAPIEDLIVVAAMARKVGAAVKYGPTRFDQHLAPHFRFPITAYVKMGGKKDGTLTAMTGRFLINVGAYGGQVGSDTVSDFYHSYVAPFKFEAIAVNTNAFAYAGPMRDVGESYGHFILESTIDMLAEKLGVDPYEFRLKNMRKRENAVDPVTNARYTGWGAPEAVMKAAEAFKWKEKWKGWGVPSRVEGTKRVGVGVAFVNCAKGAISPPIAGEIEVSPDGTVTFYTGLTDHGAGGRTAYAIMTAEALGLTSLDNVRVVCSDTSLTRDSGVTAGSRSTRVAGTAIVMAVKDLKRQWFPIIAEKLGTKPDDLEFGEGYIYSKSDPSKRLSFKEAAALLSKPIRGVGTYVPPRGIVSRVGGAKFVEVEVDIETADVRIREYVMSLDIGRVIFWKGAISQARGGFVGMGLSQTFFEGVLRDPITGSYLNPNFHDYKVATIMEAPDPDKVKAIWEEYHDPISGFGEKGIGENVLIGVSPAIANALSNALGGYRFTKLPITKADIIEAIQWMRRTGRL